MRSGARTGVWLAGFALLCFVYFLPRWHDWNQDARMDMTMSIVNHGTIDIDAYYFNTGDEDKYKGHYYSNKAPGQSLLGVPVFVVYKGLLQISPVRYLASAFEGDSGWSLALADAQCTVFVATDPCRFIPPKLDFALLQYVESGVTAAVPSVLLLLLFFWFLGYFSDSLVNRCLLTMSLGLATIVFPYAQNLYSHVPAAALEFTAFVLIYILGTTPRAARPGTRWLLENRGAAAFLAGFALGLAVVFEYPTALVSLLLAGYALQHLGPRQTLNVVAGAVPALAIVLAYNYAAFRNPLSTGYSCYETIYKNQECQGIGGFTWPPKASAVSGMSLSRYRGLFFLSPFLLLAFPGYVLWLLKKRTEWPTLLTALGVPVVFFFAISCYWGWFGGQVAGPRYITPLVPFLALPIIFVLDRLNDRFGRTALYALGAMSLLNVWVETIGGRAFGWTSIHDPLFTYNFPQLFQGQVPLNLGIFMGLGGWRSLLPLLLLLAGWTGAMMLGTASQPIAEPVPAIP